MNTVQGTREYLLKYNIKPSMQRIAIMDYLTEQGAVKALVIDEKNVRFDIDTSSHAHFMCLGCGCVYDLPIENQEAIQLEGVGELIITEIHLYYKGYCKKCTEEKRKNILL